MSKVIIVDDHPIVRMAIQFLVEKEGHCVVAETGDGIEALALVDLHYPDIVVVDVDILTLNGIEVVRALREKSFPGIIIVISGKNPEFYSPRSALSGADGFISKKNNLPELVTAIKAAQNGYSYFPALLNNRESCCFYMPVLVKDACHYCEHLPILTLTY
ncbi:response regulator [Serratia fonticola]